HRSRGGSRLASGRQRCGSKGAYNRPSYPCHYCTYRGGLLRQGAVDKAKADDQRHAGERQHHHLKVRKAVVGKRRKIVHDMPPKDVTVISRSEPAEGSWWRPCNRGGPGRPTLRAVTGSLPIRVRFSRSRSAQVAQTPTPACLGQRLGSQSGNQPPRRRGLTAYALG